MRRIFRILLIAALWSALVPVAMSADLGGTWQGPWYRGMTSGTMVLEVTSAGEGTVQFVNLDNFGEEAVALQRVEVNGAQFKFTAAGEGAGVFVATAGLVGDGAMLLGEGLYDGFQIKFKLKRR